MDTLIPESWLPTAPQVQTYLQTATDHRKKAVALLVEVYELGKAGRYSSRKENFAKYHVREAARLDQLAATVMDNLMKVL